MVVSQGRPGAVVLMVAFALQDVFVLTLDKNTYPLHVPLGRQPFFLSTRGLYCNSTSNRTTTTRTEANARTTALRNC